MSESCNRCGAVNITSPLGVCPLCLLQDDDPPVTIGGLELEDEIGRGGMGSVYRARDVKLDRIVAVKFLPADLAEQEEFQARFAREAKALAMMSHPNIVTVHDFGKEDGQSYIVMEYVVGNSLAEHLPMPQEEAVKTLREVCDALSYSHGKGIIHRDIKPDNILVDEAGHVKVTDFGISRIVGRKGWTVTTPDVVIGTPHYMAPEAEDGAEPDPRMDIYSLGVVLYQTLTGRLPKGDFKKLDGPLDAVVRKALAPKPEDRFASVDEFRKALEVPSVTDDFPPDEMTWLRAVALLQSISTAVALLAVLMMVTPRKLGPDHVNNPIWEWIEGGYSRVRFEVWYALAALATFAFAIIPYGLLRRHWRLKGWQQKWPDRPVGVANYVLVGGAVALGVYLAQELLGTLTGFTNPIRVVTGGIIEVAVLYFFWVTVLQCWRTGRPLRREPRLWAGFAMALIPPITELALFIYFWQPAV